MRLRTRDEIDTYCGLDCKTCDYRESCNCGGCIATGGKPFHGECEIANCVNKREAGFCGECPDFPCEIIMRYSNDNQHGDNPKGARIERCKKLKAKLVSEARDGLEVVACCGFHCDYCWMAQWCGGCRSEYNCCSFATVCEDNVCTNLACSKDKKLNGCYECDELDGCLKGYFANTNEFLAKGAALFIKKYGINVYKEVLRKSVEDGIEYPKSFDQTGSVSKVIEMLERYI